MITKCKGNLNKKENIIKFTPNDKENEVFDENNKSYAKNNTVTDNNFMISLKSIQNKIMKNRNPYI